MHEHFGRHGRALDDAAVGRHVALEDSDAAFLRERIGNGTDDLGVEDLAALDVLAHGFARNGRQVRVEQARAGELVRPPRRAPRCSGGPQERGGRGWACAR